MATFEQGASGSKTGIYKLVLAVTESSTDPRANLSIVNYSLKLVALTSTRFDGYGIGWSVTLGGNVVSSHDRQWAEYSISSYGELTLASGSASISHDSDGKKSLICSAAIDMEGPYNSPGAGPISISGGVLPLTNLDRTAPTVSCTVQSVDVTSVTIRGSSNVTSDLWEYSINGGSWVQYSSSSSTSASKTISNLSPATTYRIKVRARKASNHVRGISSETSSTTLGGADINSIPRINCGNHVAVKFTPKASGMYYKIKFAMAGMQDVLETIGQKSGTSQITYNSTYDFPLTILPSSVSGTVTATLYTYRDSEYSQLAGTSEKSFTISVQSSVVPTISSAVLSPVNSNAWMSSEGLYCAGYTKIRVATEAQAGDGATLSSSSIVISGAFSATGPSVTSDIIEEIGTKSITITVTDSRGRKASVTRSCEFLDYQRPSVSFSAVRGTLTGGIWTSNTSGPHIKVTASAQISLVNSGNEGNIIISCTGKSNKSITGTSGTVYYTDTDAVHAYSISASITDSAGFSASSTAYVSTISVPFTVDVDYGCLGFGMIPQNSKAVDIANDWTVWKGGYRSLANLIYQLSGNSVQMKSGNQNLHPAAFSFDWNINFDDGNQTGQRSVRFGNTSGENKHDAMLYGGSPSSGTAIGAYDTNADAVIWAYDDIHKVLNLGDYGSIHIAYRPIEIEENNDSDGSAIKGDLNTLLAMMVNGDMMPICIRSSPYIAGSAYYGTLVRHSSTYAVLDAASYNGCRLLWTKSDGVWDEPRNYRP